MQQLSAYVYKTALDVHQILFAQTSMSSPAPFMDSQQWMTTTVHIKLKRSWVIKQSYTLSSSLRQHIERIILVDTEREARDIAYQRRAGGSFTSAYDASGMLASRQGDTVSVKMNFNR